MTSQRSRAVLTALFFAALAVSVVHYADNYFNYADYPHGDGPEPSAGLVLAAWFVLTPIGIAGYLLFLRGSERVAALLLAVYSTSGLVGFGHFTVPGMADQPEWRLAHVVADIALGIGLFAFAAWVVWSRPREPRLPAH